MILHDYFSRELISALGWTIVHSLWQGALVAASLAILLACTRRYSSQTRYGLSAAGLLMIIGMAVLTFSNIYHSAPIYTASLNGLPMQVASFAVEQVPADESILFLPHLSPMLNISFANNLPIIVMVWLTGMLLFAIKFLVELAYTYKLKYRQTVLPSYIWQERFVDLCHRTNVRTSIRMMESALVQIPVVIGFFKPVILLPLGTLLGLPAVQVEAILAHELAHIRRHDYIVNILQALIEVLFFYHPAIWWLSSRMRTEREHCCDDIAVAVSGNPLALAKALAELQERANAPRPALAATGRKHHLLHRIRRIIDYPNRRYMPMERAVAMCVLTAGILIMSISARASFTPHNAALIAPTTSPVAETETSKTEQKYTQKSQFVSQKLSTFTDIDGTPQQMEVVLDKDEIILELSLDGKKVHPDEFAKYQEYINEASQQQQEAFQKKDEAFQQQQEAFQKKNEALQELAEEREILSRNVERLVWQNTLLDQRSMDRKNLRERSDSVRTQMKQERILSREESRRKSDSIRSQAREISVKKREEYRKKLAETHAAFETELLNDKLIANTEKYEFKLTDSELVINGVQQPQALLEKYKKLYTSHTEHEWTTASIIHYTKSASK